MKYAKWTFTYICIFRYFLYYLYLDPPFDLRVRDCSVNMCHPKCVAGLLDYGIQIHNHNCS